MLPESTPDKGISGAVKTLVGNINPTENNPFQVLNSNKDTFRALGGVFDPEGKPLGIEELKEDFGINFASRLGQLALVLIRIRAFHKLKKQGYKFPGQHPLRGNVK